jgi:prolipoprotein diacylglyceryltransferase
MFPVIQLGPLSIPARPFILLAAYWLAAEASERSAKRLGLQGDDAFNIAFIGGLAGVIGARLGYVLEYWPAYQNDLGAIVALNVNTLSPAAGVVVGVVFAYLVARRKGIAHRKLLDALTPGLIVFAGALALADWASGDGYGSPSSLPWAIELWGEYRHPTQIYQLMAVIVIGRLVLRSSWPFEGARFGSFVALYAASRLIIEAFHGDSVIFSSVRVAQVWSLIVLAAALILLRIWARAAVAAPQP